MYAGKIDQFFACKILGNWETLFAINAKYSSYCGICDSVP